MRLNMKISVLHFIGLLLLGVVLQADALERRYKYVLRETPYTRLCTNKTILTINGKLPGPTIYATKGETIIVDVYNRANANITIHWHGVKMPRYPWSDGPEYVTQCPIQPGRKFSQRIVLSDEEGTLWWHAHSEWSRATVYGAIVIYPKKKNDYPFPKPHAEKLIILGEWWNRSVEEVLSEFMASGDDPEVSNAFLINGQPGDLYPCSRSDTFKLTVDFGKTYLLRMVNAVMNNIMFFKIANHNITVVGSDASYTKPFKSDYITIAPGQTIDMLLEANQNPSHYYMASRVYASAGNYDNTTTTAIVEYRGNYTPPASPLLPSFPDFNDTNASVNFTGQLKSLANKKYPVDVPLNVTTKLFFTLSINLIPCANNSCGTFNGRLSASVNNITFQLPRVDILQAYYRRIRGVYGNDFPNNPPFQFNYTQDFVPQDLWAPQNGTEVVVLDYNSTVELVFQGTNTVAGIDHPMHLHGYSFYVVGWGFGNFDRDRDPLNYNLIDPPLMETIAVPRNGWTAIRFKANNPGVWFMHCHFERHISWGMGMAFIVRNGKSRHAKILPPPPDMPRC
ncbi:laccase-14-like [Olea europaea var. sylvestris]|uniref:laccase-14-like n=1 Tax=Olea europaea var. sylvestris TaxID=158386 RepID=UPI000C1D6552|nr:laccase-14-like [Olea europaea var. sylvestris]